jgi:D-beta-D-heptose 7-phosphate kinase / D-beta-D-heptose 1-phosphate adenosyltransferase
VKRAILLAGWSEIPTRPSLREYSIEPVPGRTIGRSFAAWQHMAAELAVELSASWLVVGSGIGPVRPDVQAGFRGVTTNVTQRELTRVLEAVDAAASRSRVVTDFDSVEKKCARIRRAGRRIVFTNGVFDLFHVGHLRLLQSARALGGALVVGINSDDSARRLKGRTRPTVSQFARAEIVAGVRGVDFCAIFGQSDPRELLQAVRPDILVKGSEYTVEGVVGRELVEGWGGRVERLAHVSGWSSTGLVRAVRGRKR